MKASSSAGLVHLGEGGKDGEEKGKEDSGP